MVVSQLLTFYYLELWAARCRDCIAERKECSWGACVHVHDLPTHTHTHTTHKIGATHVSFHLGMLGHKPVFPLVSCHKSVATRQLSTCQLSQICCHKAAFHLSVVANLLPQGSFPLVSCQKCVETRQLSTWQLSQFRYQKSVSPHLLPQISCHISVATRQLSLLSAVLIQIPKNSFPIPTGTYIYSHKSAATYLLPQGSFS